MNTGKTFTVYMGDPHYDGVLLTNLEKRNQYLYIYVI